MSPAVLLLAALLAAPARAADVYIGVSGSSSRQTFSLGLAAFEPADPKSREDAEEGRLVREVVRADLLFSRSFDVLDQPPAADKDPLAAWKSAGAAFLLKASARRAADSLFVEASLTDLGSGQALFSRQYRQKEADWRQLAHTLSDDVVRQVTGRAGIATSHIAFVNNQTGDKEVYIADYDGQDVRRVTANRSLNLLPRWRPDGRALAFTSYKEGNPDLYLYDFTQGVLSVVSNRQGLNVAGGFSPDGGSLAITMSRGRQPNIFVVDMNTLTSRQVTNGYGVDSSPTFSPDGQQIAFVSDRAGNPEVHILELSTGRVRRLTRLNWCDSPSWSPNGDWIAFTGRAYRKDNLDIFLVDTTGTRLVQLTHGEGQNETPSWSPDGRYLTFSSTREGGVPKIFVMDADGSAPRAIISLKGASSTPNWGR
ncbi:MAG: Tol-Pal system beta propeller repeat protein TolB [Elusimicrobia bacterium]|nr:Tol-Pal system beta propeller repeat protein TolB [Elusimicrobiota bacterium]